MRGDGDFTYFLIQHLDSKGYWRDSSLAHFLFNELSFADSSGEIGNRYRELLHPQSASSDLWQKSGINGFVMRKDADACLVAVRERNPSREFRIVIRVSKQETFPQAEQAEAL